MSFWMRIASKRYKQTRSSRRTRKCSIWNKSRLWRTFVRALLSCWRFWANQKAIKRRIWSNSFCRFLPGLKPRLYSTFWPRHSGIVTWSSLKGRKTRPSSIAGVKCLEWKTCQRKNKTLSKSGKSRSTAHSSNVPLMSKIWAVSSVSWSPMARSSSSSTVIISSSTTSTSRKLCTILTITKKFSSSPSLDYNRRARAPLWIMHLALTSKRALAAAHKAFNSRFSVSPTTLRMTPVSSGS